jgi:hypothetical protein
LFSAAILGERRKPEVSKLIRGGGEKSS